jgi:hypothetical protein
MKTLSIVIILFLIFTNVSAKNNRNPIIYDSNTLTKNNGIALNHLKKNHLLPYLPIVKSSLIQNRDNNFDYTLQLDSLVLVDDSK